MEALKNLLKTNIVNSLLQSVEQVSIASSADYSIEQVLMCPSCFHFIAKRSWDCETTLFLVSYCVLTVLRCLLEVWWK